MEGCDPSTLRKAAPNWSLAGDKQLLEVLQNIHQNIVTRCEETNKEMNSMAAALDDAHICLQNVNNKFMALSSSQFVERRVHEDDADVAVNQVELDNKETTIPTEAESDISKLRRSLLVLESYHEPVHIGGDSDSDNDDFDEDENRMILKPKDLYAERPLPHIIGSQAWKNKWHAGLQPDDSDSDSSTSKPDRKEEDQYSFSESESEVEDESIGVEAERRDNLHIPPTTGSEASTSRSSPEMSPAAVAAELARRLRTANNSAGPQKFLESEAEKPYESTPANKKIYRPEKPAQAAIFSDEPPPFEETNQSEEENYSQSDSEDIFAELHKNKPQPYTSRDVTRVAEDLFGGFINNDHNKDACDDMFGKNTRKMDTDDMKDAKARNVENEKNSTLFEDESESELFIDKPRQLSASAKKENSEIPSVKKPACGVSLFGSNQNSESIGAAILKRNRRTSYSSNDELEDNIKPTHSKHKTVESAKTVLKAESERKVQSEINQKNIIEDLFTKPSKTNLKSGSKNVKDAPKPEHDVNNKVDLFSDNLFDDIDDIFTSDIVAKVPMKQDSKHKKLLFDESNVDDLFADITLNKQTTTEKVLKSDAKTSDTIFEDNIFVQNRNENPSQNIESQKTYQSSTKQDVLNKVDVFGDINDDLFFHNKVNSDVNTEKTLGTERTFDTYTDLLPDSTLPNVNNEARNKPLNNPPIANTNNTPKNNKETDDNSTNSVKTSKTGRPPVLYEDNDSDDLFKFIRKDSTAVENEEIIRTTRIISDHETMPKTLAKPNTKENTQKANIEDTENTTIPEKIKEPALLESNENMPASNENVEQFWNTNVVSSRHLSDGSEIQDQSLKDQHFLVDHNTIKNVEQPVNKSLKIMPLNTSIDDFANRSDNDITGQNKKTLSGSDVNNIFIADNELENNMLTDESNKTGHKTTTTEPELHNVNVVIPEIESSIPEVTTIKETPPEEYKFGSDIDTNIESDEWDNLLRNNLTSQTQHSSSKFNIESLNEFESKTNSDIGILETEASETNLDNDKKVDSNKNFTEALICKPQTPDVYTDIFADQPPAFEKSKEPKKSRNINALFDDDSDDEAMFFKKNDPILEDRLNNFSTSTNSNTLFGIFHDEPPDMDIDFIQKSNMIDENDNFSSQIIAEASVNSKVLKPDPFSSSLYDQEAKGSPDILDGSLNSKEIESKKTIGKLKPTNININVNTLFPGASPKKTPGSPPNLLSNDSYVNERNKTSNLKSVSFESNLNSALLDNKLSKERAKIQVRRRPSTRRARQEAVRKSAIDFGEDSTDNSSSVDEIPKIVKEDKQGIVNVGIDSYNKNQSADVEINLVRSTEIASNGKHSQNETSSKVLKTTKTVYILNDEDIFNTKSVNTKSVSDIVGEDSFEKSKEKVKIAKPLIIEDDVDNLFQDKIHGYKESKLPIVQDSKSSSVLDDLRKNDKIQNLVGVQTLGSVYTTTKGTENTIIFDNKSPKNNNFNVQDQKKPSLFDELSDDESLLFGGKKKDESNKNTKKIKNFLNSDSEEDLFGNKSDTNADFKSTVTTFHKKEIKKVRVNKSLFGDNNDNDDNLFVAKSKKSDSLKSTPRNSNIQKEPEAVFEDPLSLLGDDS